jgi:transposase
VIPDNPTRKLFHLVDTDAYKLRNLVERANCQVNDRRRIATRYSKLTRNFAAMPPDI